MQAAQQHQQQEPVSFEIQLERKTEATAAPPVKARLEEQSARLMNRELTHQMIQDKLDRAYERKAQNLASQVETQRELSDRVGITQERKNSQERAQGERLLSELGQKLTTAEAKRASQLSGIQERAREHNTRVLLVKERVTSAERAQEEKVSETISQKLTSAEERQAQLMSSIQAKAKMHNEQALARAKARQAEEQKEIDSRKNLIEEKLSRAAEKRPDPAEKARAYNQKVQEKVSNVVSGQKESADSRMAALEAKLNEAASRREGVIEQVKQAAAQSAAPRAAAASQSPQKHMPQ